MANAEDGCNSMIRPWRTRRRRTDRFIPASTAWTAENASNCRSASDTTLASEKDTAALAAPAVVVSRRPVERKEGPRAR